MFLRLVHVWAPFYGQDIDFSFPVHKNAHFRGQKLPRVTNERLFCGLLRHGSWRLLETSGGFFRRNGSNFVAIENEDFKLFAIIESKSQICVNLRV